MRVKSGTVTKSKHKKVLTATKGMRDMRSKSVRRAKEALLKSGANAYAGRKGKKRDFRSLWNIRISAAAKENGTSYSKFIGALRVKGIALDRKVLASLAAERPKVFKKIIDEVK